MHQLSTMLWGFLRNLFSQLFFPCLDHIFEVPLKLIRLSKEFGTNVFGSLVERKVKTENRLSTFAVVGVVNTENFLSFIKLPFYKQTGLCQGGTFS